MHQIIYSSDSVAAEKLLRSAEQAAIDIGDPRATAIAAASRATLLGFRFHSVDEQLAASMTALDEARQIDDPVLLVAAHIAMARALFDSGRLDDCSILLE